MRGIVRLSVILSLCFTLVKADAGSKDEQPKQLFNNANIINVQQKPELLSYQQITHYGDTNQPEHVVYQQRFPQRTQHLQQASPYQHQQEPMVKKAALVPQHQPTPVAMVIIAQPAYIPVSMLQQGNVAQQLLNYFQGNSQARYQYVPIKNHQQPQQQYIPAAVPTQQISQYVQYQPQQERVQLQTALPPPQAQQTQFYPHESLPTPQALVSQHVVPNHLPQVNAVEGRALQYIAPHQQISQQQIPYQYQQLQQADQQLSQYNVQHQLQQTEQQQHGQQKPQQLTEISQLAQQAAEQFIMNGGLQGGSRTAPAIITGLEHFSPEQQEKIKTQLSAHFGSPLKPLSLEGMQDQTGPKILPHTKYYQDQMQKLKTEKFLPSIEVKDGEITQTTSEGSKL